MARKSEIRTIVKSARRLARALDLQSRRIDRQLGLTLPQLIVLQCVRDLGEVTSRAISLEADLSPPTVVGILDKLEEKGFVERYRSTHDRRVVHTRLTDSGRRLLSLRPSVFGESFDAAFAALPEAERKRVISAMELVSTLALPGVASLDDPPEQQVIGARDTTTAAAGRAGD